ncbi:unnamed protein product [Adineta steineri]|uniref:Uncharacterized protein n=1 Tax=Adineta steineri TaxID=433720 RepID=A0A813TMT2_9BILA|nr:unnamed protein product [Adineta steineri]CAF3823339.1 unnamed protein product [Adineta steineri]
MDPTLDDISIEVNEDLRSENILPGQQEYNASHTHNHSMVASQNPAAQQFQINGDINESFSTRDLIVATNIRSNNQSSLPPLFGIISGASQNTSNQIPTIGVSRWGSSGP